MKRLTDIWSSRGQSIYCKVTIVKFRLVPKLVYTSSLLPTSLYINEQVNHIFYFFYEKGRQDDKAFCNKQF